MVPEGDDSIDEYCERICNSLSGNRDHYFSCPSDVVRVRYVITYVRRRGGERKSKREIRDVSVRKRY